MIRAGNLLAGRAAERDRPRLALLGAIVDSSDDAIIGSGVNGLITSWNPAAERIYGYSAEQAVGRSAELVLTADLRGEETEILNRFVASQHAAAGNGSAGHRGSSHHETVLRRSDGTTFPASVMLSAIRDDDGALIGTSTIARDITEQLRAADELRAQMADLERAEPEPGDVHLLRWRMTCAHHCAG